VLDKDVGEELNDDGDKEVEEDIKDDVGVGVEKGEFVLDGELEAEVEAAVVDTTDAVVEESELVVWTPIIVIVEGVPETCQLSRNTEKGFSTYQQTQKSRLSWSKSHY
jgi:hypothetical protein